MQQGLHHHDSNSEDAPRRQAAPQNESATLTCCSNHNIESIRNDREDVVDAAASESSPCPRMEHRISSNIIDDADGSIPSNETLLGTAFITFMGFALLQLCFALIAGSEAMMGDSAAMIVDAMTYLFNLYAERKKSQVNGKPDEYASGRYTSADITAMERTKRKRVLQLEILPPLFSVSILVVVTVIILRSALQTLILDLYRSQSEQLNPDVDLMLIFSSVNLLLDGLNVFCFAKAKHLRGYAVVDQVDSEKDENDEELKSKESAAAASLRDEAQYMDSEFSAKDEDCYGHWDADEECGKSLTCERKNYADRDSASDIQKDFSRPERYGSDQDSNEDVCSDHDDLDGVVLVTDTAKMMLDPSHSHRNADGSNHANLNMCSAYTHVFADTLRSIAVLIAAAIAKLVPGVTSEEADSTAAVFVSILIVLSLVPLLQGLRRSGSELISIMRAERHEARQQVR
ncbi:hypothetical protein MPSEU_000781100 [Mayamaea pseudoterrestris]|nr:hypothetical protein MPSEU_000781100 [Mayamaea pseudoterrestris]